jgi:AsmA family/AsmA-like C-terminal region
MTKGKKTALIVVVVLLVILGGIAIAVPMLVNVDRYRPQVEALLQKETGKRAEIQRIALTIFPSVALQVDSFTLENPPGFPDGYFIQAKQINVVVDARALWNRQVVIKSLELSNPSIHLLSDVRGHWNFENPPQASTHAGASASKPMFTLGVISKIIISHGDVTAANLLASGRPGPTYFSVQGASSELDDVNLSAFTGSASTMLQPSVPGGSGWLSSVAYAAEPAAREVAHGTLDADALSFGDLQATNVKSHVRLYPKQFYLDNVAMKVYQGTAQGALAFNFAGTSPRYNINAKCQGVNVAQFLEAFPQARGKMSGTLDGTMKLAGEVSHSPDPLAGMQGTGQFNVRNGKLPSLQLNKNLMLLARLASLGPAAGDPSSFSSISSDLNIASGRLSSRAISIVGNGVNVDGAGSMSLAGAGDMDYQGVAKLAAAQNGVSNILGALSGASMSNGQLSFPFTLLGTLASPRFALKPGAGGLGNILGAATQKSGTQNQNNPANLLQGLTGLFGKKKTTKPPQ